MLFFYIILTKGEAQVDESIKKASEKAESFLFQTIIEISDGFKDKQLPDCAMPPEFKAHTYLA